MHSSTWCQLADKWSSSVIKMPPKRKGKKSQLSAKSPTRKTAQQNKQSPPKKAPAKMKSPATQARASTDETPAMAGNRRRQTSSSGGSREKKSKKRHLTAADIPDIVLTVVKAMPQLMEASAASTPRRSSSSHKQDAHSPRQAACHHITGTMPSTKTKDSSDEEDTEEDFGKLYSSVIHVSVVYHADNNLFKNPYNTQAYVCTVMPQVTVGFKQMPAPRLVARLDSTITTIMLIVFIHKSNKYHLTWSEAFIVCTNRSFYS